MPQTYGAGAVLILNASLKEQRSGVINIGKELSQSQLTIVRRSMEISHKTRNIPAGSLEYLNLFNSSESDKGQEIQIDDNKLQYTWGRFREYSVAIYEIISLTEEVELVLPQMLSKLRERDSLRLLNEYRKQYDRRLQGSDELARMLRHKIYGVIAEPIQFQATRDNFLNLINH